MRGKVNIYVPCLIWRKNLLDLESKRNEKEGMKKKYYPYDIYYLGFVPQIIQQDEIINKEREQGTIK